MSVTELEGMEYHPYNGAGVACSGWAAVYPILL